MIKINMNYFFKHKIIKKLFINIKQYEILNYI